MRKEEKINKIVGRIGEEFYFCEKFFEYEDSFRGVLGSILVPVSPEEAEERRRNFDEDGKLWRDAVANELTELGHEDWVEETLAENGDEAVFDLVSSEKEAAVIEKVGADKVELVECVGGGRIFRPDLEWDELYDPALWERIKEFERR